MTTYNHELRSTKHRSIYVMLEPASSFLRRIVTSGPVIFGILIPPECTVMLLLPETRDLLHFLRSQLERQCAQVAGQASFLSARRDSHASSVKRPTQQDLGFTDRVLLGQGRQQRIQGSATRASNRCKTGIACRLDPFTLVKFNQLPMLEIRMELDLVHRRHNLGSFEKRLEMALPKVGHADGPSFSRCLDLLHCSPGTLKLIFRLGKERSMDQVPCAVSTVYEFGRTTRENLQINVIQPKLFQAGVNGRRDIGDVDVDLGGHKQLFSRESTFFDSVAQFVLGSINFCSVQMAIAQIYRVLRRIDQLTVDPAVRSLVPCSAGAIPELYANCELCIVTRSERDGTYNGNGRAVVELDSRDGVGASHCRS